MNASFFAFLGVDACNTTLGVLIFSASMNFGQSWATVLALFGCTCMAFCFLRLNPGCLLTGDSSGHDLLRTDLG